MGRTGTQSVLGQSLAFEVPYKNGEGDGSVFKTSEFKPYVSVATEDGFCLNLTNESNYEMEDNNHLAQVYPQADAQLEIPEELLKFNLNSDDKILYLGVADLKALARASELAGSKTLEIRLDRLGWQQTPYGEQRSRPVRIRAVDDEGKVLARAVMTTKVLA